MNWLLRICVESHLMCICDCYVKMLNYRWIESSYLNFNCVYPTHHFVIFLTSLFVHVDLIPVIQECFTPRIQVFEARQQFNFKDWICNHLAGRFRNHSKPLWFKFKRRDGVVRMHYKMWVDDQWLPEEEVGANGCTDEDSKGLRCLQVLYF